MRAGRAELFVGGFEEGDSQLGSEYYPESENAGTVRVTSLDPLAGEIDLTGYAGEVGPQTFKAGFHCGVVR